MNKRVLVVDDQQMFRDAICDVLKLRGFVVDEADSVPTALSLMSKQIPDLALVDICMPDYDGIEFLRLINGRQDRARIPVILMTAQPKREYLEEAAKLGVRDFVVKSSFSVQELVLRIEMRLADEQSLVHSVSPARTVFANPVQEDPSSGGGKTVAMPSTLGASSTRGPISSLSTASTLAPSSSFGAPSTTGPISNFDAREGLVLKRKKIAARIRMFRNLEAKTLPGPATEILELATSMTASLPQLETVVRRDPVLSARVLSLANSAAHRGVNLVGQLDEALRNVGIDAVIDIVSSIPLVDREALHGPIGQDLSEIWWHSLATAVICDRLAPSVFRPGAYLSGLFHDLPLLFGLQALGEEWLECRTQALESGKPPSDAVSEAFGMVHGQMAQEVFSRYRLPESLAGPLRDYQNICLGRQPREPGELPRRLDAAHHLAVALGWGWGELAEVRALSQEESRTWREPERLVIEMPHLREEILKLGVLAGLPSPENPASKDSKDWGEIGFGYWRDGRYRVPDPIEHVLTRSGKVESFETPELLANAQGVRKVAVVDPDSIHWKTILACGGPLLILHKPSVGNFVPPAGVRLLRMPVPVWVLRDTLSRL